VGRAVTFEIGLRMVVAMLPELAPKLELERPVSDMSVDAELWLPGKSQGGRRNIPRRHHPGDESPKGERLEFSDAVIRSEQWADRKVVMEGYHQPS